MELKHAKKPATPVSALRINCTVVELKPGEVSVYSGFLKVLIVPLWNWNDKTVSGLILRNVVLIVPLWNWNSEDRADGRIFREVLIVPLWNWNSQKTKHVTRLLLY